MVIATINHRLFLRNLKSSVAVNVAKSFHSASPCLRNVELSYVCHDKETTTALKLTPIVVCHGLFGNKRNWNFLSKRLNKITGRTVVTYDAVNHGYSSHHPEMSYPDLASDLFSLMDKLELKQSLLIGHSMGGKTVMTASILQPERVEKLIVVDAVPSLSKSQGEVFTYMKLMKSIDMERMKSKKDVENQIKTVVKSSFMVDFLMTNLVTSPELRWRVNLDALIDSYFLIHEFPSLPEDAVYMGQTKFIGGGRSKYIGEADYPEIMKRFPQADIAHIPDAGHWVHSEKPVEFLEIAADFISS